MSDHDNRPASARTRFVLPGDPLGAEEEFEAGPGSAKVDGGLIVASRMGEASPDMSRRVVSVKPAKEKIAKVPQVGDIIVGTVESAASSIAQVTINAINDEPSSKRFAGMLSMRDPDRRRRNSTPIKPGDTLRARIFSTTNSIYHLTLDCANCGVLYTVCSFCGGRVISLGRGSVKCTECNSVDERILSDDFIAFSRNQP